eukprot:2501446-Prorocentrum_lima.AAC.1
MRGGCARASVAAAKPCCKMRIAMHARQLRFKEMNNEVLALHGSCAERALPLPTISKSRNG